MAIYAHEGLPRSGKSYEAAVYVILPALKKGRKVWAYVEGLNHQQFADLAEISLERCKELLIQLHYDDVLKIPERQQKEGWKDGWIIIDEIQDFYPSGTRKLDQTVSKFVTQHGHDGLDILIMGQSMSDVHTLWRNRITQKTQFLKRDAIGKEDSYLWTAYKGKLDGNGKIKFEKIRSGSHKYEQKYFGLYASHNDGTTNTDNHKDDRANIFKSSGFRIWLPVFVVFFITAIVFMVKFFSGTGVITDEQIETANLSKKSIQDEFEEQKSQALNKQQNLKSKPLASAPVKKEYEPIDYADKLAHEYKPRLVGYIQSESKLIGIVEFLDVSYKVKERLSFEQLTSMGWKIDMAINYIHLKKEDKNYIVTAWPVEPFGSIPQSTRQNLGATYHTNNASMVY